MSLNLRRANVVLSDGTSYSRVRLVVSGEVARLWDAGGNVLAAGPVANVELLAPREHRVTLATGDVWMASEVRGCGCS